MSATAERLDCAEKGRGGCDERPSLVAEDRSMPAIWNDPKRRCRNRAVQLHREFHRVQRIAIAMDHKAPRGNRGEGYRVEVHVLVIVGEFAGVLVEARPRGMDAASHLAMELRNKEGR